MRNALKKTVGVVMVVALMLGGLAVPSQDAQAANVNKKAEKAFAKALEEKKIKYDGKYALCDVNSDGIKELIIKREDDSILHYVIWKYAKGKVSKLADFDGEGSLLTYDKKTKTFWNMWEGDGGGITAYKLTHKAMEVTDAAHNYCKGFRETGASYYITDDGKKAEKNTKKSTKKISAKKYRQIENRVMKNNAMKMKKLRKSELILKLQRKRLYTPKDFQLSNDLTKCKGIEIKKLTMKSIQYKKVSEQSRDGGEWFGWYPYDKKTYQMKYSKKIDVYLLVDSGSGWGSKVKLYKAYSGINYKKMKKCLDKYITTFALIKDKKGKVTKLVQLFAS